MTSTLSLLHFNDVYRVTPQKVSSHPLETIDVTQFTALLHDLRGQWTLRDDGNRDGLVIVVISGVYHCRHYLNEIDVTKKHWRQLRSRARVSGFP